MGNCFCYVVVMKKHFILLELPLSEFEFRYDLSSRATLSFFLLESLCRTSSLDTTACRLPIAVKEQKLTVRRLYFKGQFVLALKGNHKLTVEKCQEQCEQDVQNNSITKQCSNTNPKPVFFLE